MQQADEDVTGCVSTAELPDWGAPDWEQMDFDTFASKLSKKLETEPAAITFEDMDAIEKWWKETMGNRRCSLVFLTKPHSWLRENVEKDRDFAVAVAAVFDRLPELIEQTQALADLLRQSHRRALVAVAHREDIHELVDEAAAD